jgi:hypothetical protein
MTASFEKHLQGGFQLTEIASFSAGVSKGSTMAKRAAAASCLMRAMPCDSGHSVTALHC